MQLENMVDEKKIQNYAREIIERFDPEKVVLFGSYAAGHATDDSDVDLLVLMDYEGKASRQALRIRRNVRKDFPLDLIVQSPSEAQRRLSSGDPFIAEALNSGRVLYERS